MSLSDLVSVTCLSVTCPSVSCQPLKCLSVTCLVIIFNCNMSVAGMPVIHLSVPCFL